MNIKEAKRIYRPGLFRDDEDLVDLSRKYKVVEGLRNDSYVHALGLTELMFSKTSRTLRMLSGVECINFLSLLKGSFKLALDRIRKNQGTARIIVADSRTEEERDSHPFKVVQDLQNLQEEYSDVLEFQSAIANEDISHFLVSDDDMVREEAPHPVLTDDTDASVVKAKMYYYNPEKAGSFSRLFDSTWAYLSGESK